MIISYYIVGLFLCLILFIEFILLLWLIYRRVIISREKHENETKNRLFTKRGNLFKDFSFIISDMSRDIKRFGKKREERKNVLYLDKDGALHATTGFLNCENIEFNLGGERVIKGLNEVIKNKLYSNNKLYHFYFIPHFYYENLNFNLFISEEFRIKLDNLERDRLRIIDNDITKTALQMDDTQSGIVRTTFIIGVGLGIIIMAVIGLAFILVV